MAPTSPQTQYQDIIQEDPSDSPKEADHLVVTGVEKDPWTLEWNKPPSTNSSTQNSHTPYKRAIWKSFAPDMAQWFAAAAIFLAIAITLDKYNGVPVPEWKFAINLNSLVALLTTFMRASMTAVVSDAISQMKWTWFSKPRNLRDLDTFEHAAGSVMGSASTFARIRSFHPVLFGAAITILSLGVGPFAQQAIKSVSCDLPTIVFGNATIPVIHHLSSDKTFRISAGQFELDYQTKGVIINSAANPNVDSSPVSIGCPTGNCTFDAHQGITHSSLGLCTRCKDTTDSIIQASNYTLFKTPSNIIIDNQRGLTGTFMAVGHFDAGQATQFASWPEPYNSSAIGLIDLLVFTVNGCKEYDYFNEYTNLTTIKQNCTATRRRPDLTQMSAWLDIISAQCVYYPCMKNYHAAINAGILEETLISSVPATPDEPDLQDADVTMNYTAIKEPCFYMNQQYDRSNFSLAPKDDSPIYYNFTPMVQTAVPQYCINTMQTVYTMALGSFMSTAFNESGIGDTRQEQVFGMNHGVMDNIWFSKGSWWLSSLYNNGNTTFETINSVFDSVATAYTNHVRNSGIQKDGQNSSAINDPANTVIGQVWHTTICTKFAWRWLIFPAALILATLSILVTTIMMSRLDPQQLPIWKSSLLPLLYYGFGKEKEAASAAYDGNREEVDRLLGKDELSDLAKDRMVFWRRTDRGAELYDVE